MNLRKFAQGQPCMVRSSACNWNPETTVLAHIRRANIGSMGKKPPSICAVWACSACHDVIDRRVPHGEALEGLILDGLLRTLDALVRAGHIRGE